MDRINGAGTVDIGGGRRGFIDEDLGVGQEGTEVTAFWLNMTQEEMIKVIETAGLVLNPADWTQLWQALQILGLSAGARSRRWTAVISMTLSSAPGAPAAGDTYLVPTGATGIWATQVGKIAEWNGTAWFYFTPVDGHGISLPDGRVFERIAGVYVEKLALDAQSGKWTYGVASGSASAIGLTLSPAPSQLVEGMDVCFKVSAANVGPCTLNLNGLGARPLYSSSQVPLAGGELVSGGFVCATYSTSLNGGAGAWVITASTGGIAAGVPPVVGGSRNLKANLTAASNALTFTADEVSVKSALGGSGITLGAINKTVNLGTVGVGGIDIGAAPSNGFVGVYLIYNADTKASALLATNATGAVLPEVYAAGNMPAGFTHSQLVSVWPTDATGKFVAAYQRERLVARSPQNVLTSTVPVVNQSLSISAAVPRNAVMVSGYMSVTTTASTSTELIVSCDSSGVGGQRIWFGSTNNQTIGSSFVNLVLPAVQTMYYTLTNTGGTTTANIAISSYQF